MLASSYSGETEETLACFEAAGEAGAPRVALTTGGRLAEAAREAGVPVIGVPSGMRPRAAVVYSVVGALGCAAACGAAPSLREEVEGAGALLRRLAEAAAEDGSDPKRLAMALQGRTPVFYGGGATAPVAYRWKTQVNENAKRPAFAAVLPEADHNEVCGWERPGDLAAVLLEEPGQDARIRRAPGHHGQGDRRRRVRPSTVCEADGRVAVRARDGAGDARRPGQHLPGAARRDRSHPHDGARPRQGAARSTLTRSW